MMMSSFICVTNIISHQVDAIETGRVQRGWLAQNFIINLAILRHCC